MLKYLAPKSLFLSMPQKSISAYFKKEPQGTKRKPEDCDYEVRHCFKFVQMKFLIILENIYKIIENININISTYQCF